MEVAEPAAASSRARCVGSIKVVELQSRRRRGRGVAEPEPSTPPSCRGQEASFVKASADYLLCCLRCVFMYRKEHIMCALAAECK